MRRRRRRSGPSNSRACTHQVAHFGTPVLCEKHVVGLEIPASADEARHQHHRQSASLTRRRRRRRRGGAKHL